MHLVEMLVRRDIGGHLVRPLAQGGPMASTRSGQARLSSQILKPSKNGDPAASMHCLLQHCPTFPVEQVELLS